MNDDRRCVSKPLRAVTYLPSDNTGMENHGSQVGNSPGSEREKVEISPSSHLRILQGTDLGNAGKIC